MNYIKTAKNEIIECDFFGESSIGQLQIIVKNVSIVDAVRIIYDEEQTSKIEFYADDKLVETKENYIKNIVCVTNADGSIRFSLRRPYVGEE